MTQTQLFMLLLVTAMLCITGAREIWNRRFTTGAMLFAIPVCGWISIWVTS